MANRTGRKVIASAETRKRALSIKKSNPGMSNADIAKRLNVTPRQIQYWLSKTSSEAAE